MYKNRVNTRRGSGCEEKFQVIPSVSPRQIGSKWSYCTILHFQTNTYSFSRIHTFSDFFKFFIVVCTVWVDFFVYLPEVVSEISSKNRYRYISISKLVISILSISISISNKKFYLFSANRLISSFLQNKMYNVLIFLYFLCELK